jgi:DNA end-binding protein Ku
MAPRSSWKGYLRLSLVSVPVQAFNAAASDGGEIHFHQLHATCHSRIRYEKVCPVHGEVSNDEIVRGYEYAKGKYVVVDDDEIDKLRTDADRAITIDTFIAPHAIDPAYFDGRTYYLVPDGPMGNKPYAVLLRALLDEDRWAIGQAVFFGREQLVLLRPLAQVLCLEMLHYHDQVRLPDAVVADIPLAAVNKQELRLASKLIAASTQKKFDIAKYDDTYTAKLKELIEAKVAGKEIVAAPEEEETPVINLMDALRKSVDKAQSRPKKSAQVARLKPAKRRRPAGRRSAG